MGKKFITEKKEKTFKQVLKLMETGMSCSQACRKVKLLKKTFFAWIKKSEEMRTQYAQAREAMLDVMADEILELANMKPNKILELSGLEKFDHVAINWIRYHTDTKKWIMSKIAPKQYGEKLSLSGDDDSPLTIIIKGDDAKL